MFHILVVVFFFFKQKTAYEMRISDWSSACALPISFLRHQGKRNLCTIQSESHPPSEPETLSSKFQSEIACRGISMGNRDDLPGERERPIPHASARRRQGCDHKVETTPCSRSARPLRSEEHTSELQSLMRISYAVFCLKKKKK